MKQKIIILTGSELRHQFFYNYLISNQNNFYDVVKIYSEDDSNSLLNKYNNNIQTLPLFNYIEERSFYEKDFFELFIQTNQKFISNDILSIIPKGSINNNDKVEEIVKFNPDILIAYGCSIIKSDLINLFPNRFINIHLGLSPYYRGSGTNFWPLVNNEPQLVGVTFMYIDSGIDTGKIFHQIRPDLYSSDNVHTIGNRLIIKTAKTIVKIIEKFQFLNDGIPNIKYKNYLNKFYKKSDFNSLSIETMLINFSSKFIQKYLINKQIVDLSYPILQNKVL